MTKCVNCQLPIKGLSYSGEPWVGVWCSEECQREFGEAREQAYAQKKGEAYRLLGEKKR